MGDCENILGDWGWLGVIARFSKAHSFCSCIAIGTFMSMIQHQIGQKPG